MNFDDMTLIIEETEAGFLYGFQTYDVRNAFTLCFPPHPEIR
jgi:hypothetical protein